MMLEAWRYTLVCGGTRKARWWLSGWTAREYFGGLLSCGKWKMVKKSWTTSLYPFPFRKTWHTIVPMDVTHFPMLFHFISSIGEASRPSSNRTHSAQSLCPCCRHAVVSKQYLTLPSTWSHQGTKRYSLLLISCEKRWSDAELDGSLVPEKLEFSGKRNFTANFQQAAVIWELQFLRTRARVKKRLSWVISAGLYATCASWSGWNWFCNL